MSFVLRPLHISFYATNVFKANGYKRIKYIVIFIYCQLLSYYTEKKLIGSIFLLSIIHHCLYDINLFLLFFFFSLSSLCSSLFKLVFYWLQGSR